MSTVSTTTTEIEYPDSDGQPMADNTLQFRWIAMLQENIDDTFRDDPAVFVAGDLLWYPVEGNNSIRVAPDTMVAFGRPKGYRGSYLQWREDDIAPQVVFEVLSPGNRPGEMRRKFEFYEQYGVEEYYLIDPDNLTVKGWQRESDELAPIDDLNGWISPRLSIRFEVTVDDLRLFKPDGSPFLTFLEVQAARRAESARADAADHRADAEADRADTETVRADAEADRADTEANRADKEAARANAESARADNEATRADAAEALAREALERTERLAAQLRELGGEPAD